MFDPELRDLHRHLAQYPQETVAVVLARFPLFFARLLMDAVGGERGPITTDQTAHACRQAVVEACSWLPVVPVNASQWLRCSIDEAAVDAFTVCSLEEIADRTVERFLEALELVPDDARGVMWVAVAMGVFAATLAELGSNRPHLDFCVDLARAQAAIDAVKLERLPAHPVMWLTFGEDPTPHYVLCPVERAQGTFQLQPAEVAFFPGAATPWDAAGSRFEP